MAKIYKVPFARLREYNHPHPERTAYTSRGKGLDFDYTCQVWTNREAMLKACEMSDTGKLGSKPWRPLIE